MTPRILRAVPQGDFLALRAHSVDKRQPLQRPQAPRATIAAA